eukprot:GHVO01050804.1.p1 GENE.GHVO01050804.1~~GHVO01050804.1.p1  ORF type:complete len:147 (-),score=7.11 GHVO01050804.1:348-788(-)
MFIYPPVWLMVIIYFLKKESCRPGRCYMIMLIAICCVVHQQDPKNRNGGRWLVKIPQKSVDELWLCTMLCLIGGILKDDEQPEQDFITGAVVSARPRFCRIALWVTDSDSNKTSSLGSRLFEEIKAIVMKHGGAGPPSMEFEKFWT